MGLIDMLLQEFISLLSFDPPEAKPEPGLTPAPGGTPLSLNLTPAPGGNPPSLNTRSQNPSRIQELFDSASKTGVNPGLA